MKFGLDGKICIITGATEGLGRATAEVFLKDGAIVAFCSRRPEAVEKTAKELSEYGEVIGYAVDVSKRDDVFDMVKSVHGKYGRIDVLINNAGIVQDAQFKKMTDDQFERVIDVNLKGTYYCLKAVIPYMIEQNYGKIVNTSSISAINGNFGQSNYAAAKAGVIGLTRVIAKEIGKHNININAVLPGTVETPMTAGIPEHLHEMRVKSTAVKRIGEPVDVAYVNAFLASEGARHISAQTIIVDGGRV